MAPVKDAIHVIDNFLDDPMPLRKLALAADYPALSDTPYFPGRNSARRYALPGLDEYVQNLTGQQLKVTAGSAHNKFRLCLAGEKGLGGVHIDNCHWTGVLYLSLDEHAEGGTDFFRHRPSNTVRAPVYPEDWAAWESRSVEKLWSDVIVPHTNDDSKWELIRRVDAKFNRLVLFEPWQWHNAGPGFGSSVENARLIYLLSYDRA
jgi:hypothetical protein